MWSPRSILKSTLSLLERIPSHEAHTLWHVLENLHQLVIKLIFSLNFIPSWVCQVVDRFEVLEISSIFSFLHLHVSNFFELIMVDENAWELLRQFWFGFLSLIRCLEANEGTGKSRVWHQFYALDITVRTEYILQVFSCWSWIESFHVKIAPLFWVFVLVSLDDSCYFSLWLWQGLTYVQFAQLVAVLNFFAV